MLGAPMFLSLAFERTSALLQVAAEVDDLVDRDDLQHAEPLMRAAAARILSGCNKHQHWASAGGLPCPLSGSTAASEAAPRPLFLARFHAAWIYAELATMFTSLLERQQQYGEACGVLRALLGGSACPSRRYFLPLPMGPDSC